MYFPVPGRRQEHLGTSRGTQLLGQLPLVPATVTRQQGRSQAETNTRVTDQGWTRWEGQQRGIWSNFLSQERNKGLHTLTDLCACEHCPGPGDEHAGGAGALLWSLFTLGRLWLFS